MTQTSRGPRIRKSPKWLEARRDALLERKGELEHDLAPDPSLQQQPEYLSPEDQAVRERENALQTRVSGIEAEELGLVEEALGRLDRGEYGFCQNCQKQISDARLRAVPWARYCTRCQRSLAGEATARDGGGGKDRLRRASTNLQDLLGDREHELEA
ncbi:MAG: TraR/DksA C4-type zinc finger protein [Bryobacteraceae bacterium]|nr:TraR/DksA C4-type zinc finger protein [Bryobacteraceae bacterium]